MVNLKLIGWKTPMDFTATLYNLNGQVVTRVQSNENTTTIFADAVSTGLYLLEVKGEDKTFRTKMTIGK
jgi:hypothetical protein